MIDESLRLQDGNVRNEDQNAKDTDHRDSQRVVTIEDLPKVVRDLLSNLECIVNGALLSNIHEHGPSRSSGEVVLQRECVIKFVEHSKKN